MLYKFKDKEMINKMKTIYFMRHSEPLKPININNNDSLQVQNEKWVLTVNGEMLEKEKSEYIELKNFDIVISSNYVRAISTAKYFTKDKIFIDDNFGERKFGINNWDELPKDFGKRQFDDFNYKLPNGESINEVIEREYNSLINILNNSHDKKVLIVGHSTAIASLFSKWCEIDYTDGYKFNGKRFFDGKWNYCEAFKLQFDDNNDLISIDKLIKK